MYTISSIFVNPHITSKHIAAESLGLFKIVSSAGEFDSSDTDADADADADEI